MTDRKITSSSVDLSVEERNRWGVVAEQADRTRRVYLVPSYHETKPAGAIDPDEIVRRFLHWVSVGRFEVETLATAVDSLKSMLDYSGHYNALLLGQVDEAEFDQLTLDFAYEPIDIDKETLAWRIKSLLANTNVEFTPSELAQIFKSEEIVVEEAVAMVVEDIVPTLPLGFHED